MRNTAGVNKVASSSLSRTGTPGVGTADTGSWVADAEAPSCRPLPGHARGNYRNKHFTPPGASGSKLMAQPGHSLVQAVLNTVLNLMHSSPVGA